MNVLNPNHLLTAPSQKPAGGRGVGLQTMDLGSYKHSVHMTPGFEFQLPFLIRCGSPKTSISKMPVTSPV